MKNFPIPKVLECSHYILPLDKRIEHRRFVRDYEFDLYIDGERDMYIDGKYYTISKDCLVFRKPGQEVVGYGSYNTYILTLDFSNTKTDENYVRSSSLSEQPLLDTNLFDIIPEVFIPENAEEIAGLYRKIMNCITLGGEGKNLQNQYIMELLLLILHDAAKHNRKQMEKKATKESYIEKACQYINKNYTRQICIDDIASHLSLNKNYLIRLFKKELFITPNQYILNTRLFYARLMLIETQVSVKTIAYETGFNTPSYFIKCFREKYGKSPLAYKTEINSSKKL